MLKKFSNFNLFVIGKKITTALLAIAFAPSYKVSSMPLHSVNENHIFLEYCMFDAY